MGGELDDGGAEKVTYAAGLTKCIMLKEGIGMEEVRRMVIEITGNDLSVKKFTTGGMVMEVEGDADVRMFVKENDEHEYFYVGDNDGPKRRTHRAAASREGRIRSYDHGVSCGRSGRDRDDMVEEGRKGVGLKKVVVSKMGGCIGDHPQTRLRVGREIIELSDDYEISVASEDVGDDEGALVHPMETHDMGTVDGKTGRVVGGDDLDDDYDRCILPPPIGDSQGTRSRRYSKCGEVGHTRRTCHNPRADFGASYESNVVEVEDLLDGSPLKQLKLHSGVFCNSIDKFIPATWK
ncbi:hypothetical protein Cgig2_003378 [Carnegiea gigantea]|uniref:Uncharacterized protein n=1 Tax=Carnegiea gigantea TaxID=171969 RepID=A0A9Q1JI21_9CARY|nr:hypothetical protein Cgig2_003378 [Carnegiea gigantea]